MNMFKKNGGFTLVELIVVIAILAILAAVAVPAYSGYIKKANEAADTQILSAANTAFAAAATENRIDFNAVDTYLNLTATAQADGTGCTVAVTAEDNALAKAILADFTVYYGDDEIVFDYYTGASFGADGNLVTTEPTA